MASYTIRGFLVCSMVLTIADRQFGSAKILPERFHARHEAGRREMHKTHHLIDWRNQEISKNLTRAENDEHAGRNSPTIRRRRHDLDELLFEMEVEEVQNTSICSYTVEPVEDETGNWLLKNLQHIKCNKVGNKCHQGDKPHCCIQTYKMIELKFSNYPVHSLKIYTGCVCAYGILDKVKSPLNNTDD